MKVFLAAVFLTSCVQTFPNQIAGQRVTQAQLQAEARRQKELAEYNMEREVFAQKVKQAEADRIYNENGNRIQWTQEEKKFNQNAPSWIN